MKLLLDTHAFLWLVLADDRLSESARQRLVDPDAELYLSAASIWEMAIKVSVGRLTLPAPPAVYVAEKLQQGFRALPVEWNHAVAVAKLPLHHRDPFDRLLVAQALTEDLPLVTSDPEIRPYGVNIIW